MKSLGLFLLVLPLLLLTLLLPAPQGPGGGPCSDGQIHKYSSGSGTWSCQDEAAGGIPAGAVVLIVSGSCPAGYVEEASLNGKTLFGTLAANADIGGTGGADSVTPAGTNSAPVFTGSPLAGHAHGVGTYGHAAPTFTGDASTAVVNHVHVQNKNSATSGGLVGFAVDTSTSTSVASGYSTANPTGGVASYTPTGAVSNPAFSGSSSSDSAGTPAGSVSAPTFTGTSFDNRSAFVKVIFCRKT